MSNVHRLSTAIGGDAGAAAPATADAGAGGQAEALGAAGAAISPTAKPVGGPAQHLRPVVSGAGERVGGEAGGRGQPINSQSVPQAATPRPPAGANPHTPDGLPATPAWVQVLLEEAGATLLALPHTGYTTRLRQGGLEWVRDAVALAPGSGDGRMRPAVPSGVLIDRMDRVLAWVSLIPDGNQVLRRVVGARALVHPLTGRHLFAWRRLGTALGADHKAVQRWHAQGLEVITRALNASPRAGRGQGTQPPP